MADALQPSAAASARRSVIIDCDPGVDDAVNLMLAAAWRDTVEVLGVTTVAGNVPLSLTERNARMICELCGAADIPVYAGCPRPLVRAPVFADDIHGATGMDGMEHFEPSRALQPQHAVDFIIDTLRAASAESITLVITGPCTNIAVAIVKAPDILESVRDIVLMGGARTEGGNITPSAEFNIYADPHAADVVLKCGRPLTMIGLDATHQALSTPPRIAAIAAQATPAAEAAAGMLRFVSEIEKTVRDLPGAPVHDPCTMAFVLRPDLFQGRDCFIQVETQTGAGFGHTAVDLWGAVGEPPNAHWIETVDAEGLFALITEAVGRLA